MKFTDLDLKPEILDSLSDMGFTDLTEIQEKTLPHILEGKDLLALAQTGSGKTSACAIPLVQLIDQDDKALQGLILVPTRELAQQYVSEMADVARKSNVVPFAVYGGFNIEIQQGKLNQGVHILVATPGRLIDLLRNSNLSLSKVRTFVLDEADEMLKMGFIDDVEFILSCMIHQHQTMFFSATMPKQIKHLVEKYLKEPERVELISNKKSPDTLEHHFRMVRPDFRRSELEKYIEQQKPKQVIIFSNSRHNGEKLFSHLKKKLKSVDFIHGGLEQAKRTSLFNRFKRTEVKYMIATDIASRGLDFSHVTHVINYEIPNNNEIYTHRTGRTARMGRKGVAMTFFTPRDLRDLRSLLKVNHIEPIYHGKEPDFSNISNRSHRKKHYRGSRKGKKKSPRPKKS